MYRKYTRTKVFPYRHFSVGRRCCFKLVRGKRGKHLQQTQLSGAGNSLRAPLDLQFVKDSAVVPFDRIQRQEKPLANLLVREPLSNEPEYFQLTLA